MKCPICNYYDTKVIDTRPTEDGFSVRRRRECISCGKRFTTYERVEEINIVVVKRDGTRQGFNRNKIINGLIRACEKRSVTLRDIENITVKIEKEIFNSFDKEIPTETIGELVMNELKNIDDVAYVRFASVYRQFKDINTFMDELKKILDENKK